jgi:hypothetical protein
MTISFNVYCNNYHIKINKNYIVKNICYNIFDWNILNNKYYLTNLVFPEYQSSNHNNNIWFNLKSRPFKICPCNYDELLSWSNNSIINVIVSDDMGKIIGFCVISDIDKFYFINILCTNISQGIGTLIIDFIKEFITINIPIKLKATFNSRKFYLKKGFIKKDGNIMEYSN